MVEMGDELVEREDVPAASRRDDLHDGHNQPASPADQPDDTGGPTCGSPTSELDPAARARLDKMGMHYDGLRGIVVCARGHHLVPKHAGARDDEVVVFRVIGQPCRGCPFRGRCTRSTKPDLRKEVTIPIEQASRAAEIRDGGLDTPIGVDPTADSPPGDHRIRRPGMLPAARRKAFRRAARLSELEVRVTKTSHPQLYANAEQWGRHRRCRQRMPQQMRRRYHRLGKDDRVKIRWMRLAPPLAPKSAAP